MSFAGAGWKPRRRRSCKRRWMRPVLVWVTLLIFGCRTQVEVLWENGPRKGLCTPLKSLSCKWKSQGNWQRAIDGKKGSMLKKVILLIKRREICEVISVGLSVERLNAFCAFVVRRLGAAVSCSLGKGQTCHGNHPFSFCTGLFSTAHFLGEQNQRQPPSSCPFFRTQSL